LPGLFGIYEIGRRSLMSYQTAMSTVGHNVANATTPGYRRQRVDLRATPPEINALGALGTGVRIESIHRIEDRFLELALHREVPVLAGYTARADVLAQTELIFTEPSDSGITTVLDEFFDGWDDLATNPEDPAARESVVRLGMSLAASIRTARGRLVDQQASVTGDIGRQVEDANRVLRELSTLNRSILRSSPGTTTPAPDLEDRRDFLMSQLAEMIGAVGSVEEDGTATMRLSGRVILQHDTVDSFSLDVGRSLVPNLETQDISAHEFGGEIGGLISVRDEEVASAIRRLDEFAVSLANDVNRLHGQGFDAYGNRAGAFFALGSVGTDGVTGAASAIDVTRALRNDANLVAAGGTDAPGDNSVALEIAALRNDPQGLTAMLRSLVVDVGSAAREAEDLALGQQIIVDGFVAQQQAVSGVSLDEEAANLMQFQRTYEAAARVLTIADEMVQTILSI
jgi:flagellar hook-associated protein 1 FlgK